MTQLGVENGLAEEGAAQGPVVYPEVLSTLTATASGVRKLTQEEITEIGVAVGKADLDASSWTDALPQVTALQAISRNDMVRSVFNSRGRML